MPQANNDYQQSPPVLAVVGISKSFGALKASDNVGLELRENEIHALIGPNGAGKSTLIKQIAGSLFPDSGSIALLGSDVTQQPVYKKARLGLGRSFQISATLPEFSVLQNVLLGLHGRQKNIFRMLSAFYKDETLMDEALEIINLVQLVNKSDNAAATLSHGERRRLEIAMALSLKPKLFLLDEPMAGLGSDGTKLITQILSKLKKNAPILLVEHDMDTVFALADRISVLVYGRIIATGSVEEIRANSEVQSAYLGEEF